MNWTVETLNATVDKELDALPSDMRARFVRICELITQFGLEHVGASYVKHLPARSGKCGCVAGTGYREHCMLLSETDESWS